MSELELNCPHCQAELLAEEQHFGREIHCPQCQNPLHVPRLRDEAEPSPDSPEVERIARVRHYYDVRRKRRQKQRERRRAMLADAVLIERGSQALEILFPCGHCDRELLVNAEYSGFDIHCPQCGELEEVPDIDDDDFGSNRLGKGPRDENFLQSRKITRVSIVDIADPAGGMWNNAAAPNSSLNPPSAPPEARPLPETLQAHLDPRHIRSTVTPEGGMVLNIVLSPESLERVEQSAHAGAGSGSGAPSHMAAPGSPKITPRAGQRPRAAAGALKTPVKDVTELALTGEGGRFGDGEMKSLWQGEIGAQRWEKVAGVAVIGLFLVTLLALTIFFLNNNTREDSQVAGAETSTLEAPPAAYLSAREVAEARSLELTPEQIEEARFMVKNYLGSESWRERLGYVRRPEIMRPLMEQYYQDRPDRPIPYNTIELEWAGIINGRLMAFLGVTDSTFRKVIFALVREDETFKVDWETLVQYNPLSWPELKQRQPREPMEFRVKLEPSNYYNFEFSDRTKYLSYRVWDLQALTGIHAYVRQDAPFIDQLDLNGLPYKTAIVELKYPEEPSSRALVEIVGFKQEGWLEDYDAETEPAPDAPAPLQGEAAGLSGSPDSIEQPNPTSPSAAPADPTPTPALANEETG